MIIEDRIDWQAVKTLLREQRCMMLMAGGLFLAAVLNLCFGNWVDWFYLLALSIMNCLIAVLGQYISRQEALDRYQKSALHDYEIDLAMTKAERNNFAKKLANERRITKELRNELKAKSAVIKQLNKQEVC